jgi:hypothetical protein
MNNVYTRTLLIIEYGTERIAVDHDVYALLMEIAFVIQTKGLSHASL